MEYMGCVIIKRGENFSMKTVVLKDKLTNDIVLNDIVVCLLTLKAQHLTP